MFYGLPHSLRLLFVATLVGRCLGQTNKIFQWQFKDTALATSLPTCVSFPIVVKPFDPTKNNTQGTPPYYMMAFAVNQTPITSLIGTDPDNLSWTVTHPAGSKLLLSVVDATGSAGGVPPQFLTVITGPKTDCVVSPVTTPAFEVSANVTGDLQTCQPWGLRIKGGSPPYVVTLAEINSPIITNVTIPNGLDAFTYINRADPDRQLIAGISDLTGRWATGTPIVNTKGSADTSCTGLVSSSGDAATLDKEAAAALAASRSAAQRRTTATAVAVTLTLLLLLGLAVLGFFYLRKRKREAEVERAETTAHQFTVEPESKMLSITNYLVSTSDSKQDQKAPLDPVPPNPLFPEYKSPAEVPVSRGSDYIGSKIVLPTGKAGVLGVANPSNSPAPRRPSSRTSNPGFANFPATSIRRSAKAVEAAIVENQSPESEYSQDGIPASSTTRSRMNARNDSTILQHQDAESVRELPPPYADRTRLSRPRSS
ncbi:hypothetical protein CPC08DRAFT_720534 [Agrocybe pediades]|nr:hypothetical protein CPC08DRAFT_720534 [Agrocybe pediades]